MAFCAFCPNLFGIWLKCVQKRNDNTEQPKRHAQLKAQPPVSNCLLQKYLRCLVCLQLYPPSCSLVAGCSSIFGGTFLTNPYTLNSKGQGPAWANSLFEDNAEFGLGMLISSAQRRLHIIKHVETAIASGECLLKQTFRFQ